MEMLEIQSVLLPVPLGVARVVSVEGNYIDRKPYFSDTEWMRYQKKSFKTKNSWLLGRLAVKKIMVELYGDSSVAGYSRATVEFNQSTKRLVAHWDGQPCSEYRLSISHARNEKALTVLVSAADCDGVGADIEIVRSFSHGFVRRFCSPREYAEWEIIPEEHKNSFITLMWCLKEAYRKAVGGSVLYVDPRELCMVSYAESPSRFYPPDKSLQVFTHFDLQAWSVVLYYNNIN